MQAEDGLDETSFQDTVRDQKKKNKPSIRAHLACPALAPKPRGSGPGRPPGTRNKHRAPRYDVGKTVKRPETLKAIGKP
ncbi:hypothetical protein PV461_18850 [Streptomyces scabiei]|nr:hypothetical protein [Streptomyces scabiei]